MFVLLLYYVLLYSINQVTRTFLVILLTYVVTYLPAVAFIYVIFFCQVCTCDFIHVIRDAQFLLVASNSCVNAFVFTWRLKHFKESIRFMFCGARINKVNAENNDKAVTRNSHIDSEKHQKGIKDCPIATVVNNKYLPKE